MTTTYHGVSVPDLTDPPNGPAQFRALVDTGGAVPRFASLAEANTAYPAGQRPAGMMIAIGTRMYISDGTNFTSVAAGGIENFANAAARTAAIPAPGVNVTTTLTTDPGILWVWDGSTWQPAIEGRAIARYILGSDLAATTSAASSTTTFTLSGARCVQVAQSAGHTRGQNVGLSTSWARIDGQLVDGTGYRTRHDVLGEKQAGGAVGHVDLSSGTHTLGLYVTSDQGTSFAYLLAGSRVNVSDAGPNRGLFPL